MGATQHLIPSGYAMGVHQSCQCSNDHLVESRKTEDAGEDDALWLTDGSTPATPATVKVNGVAASLIDDKSSTGLVLGPADGKVLGPASPTAEPKSPKLPGLPKTGTVVTGNSGRPAGYALLSPEMLPGKTPSPRSGSDKAPSPRAQSVGAVRKPPKLRRMPSGAGNESDLESDWSDSDTPLEVTPRQSFRRMVSEPTARDRFQRGGHVVCVGVRLNRLVRIGASLDVGPVKCAIPFESLSTFNEKACEIMGQEYATATVRTIVKGIIQPQCEHGGKCYARIINRDSPCRGQVFVCHCWDSNWSEFVKNIDIAFKDWARKPTLWISCFALLQTKRRTPMKPEDAPFKEALKKADSVLVLRSKEVDVFNRLWPMWEMYTAKQVGILDKCDGLLMAGPATFAKKPVDARSAVTGDRDDKASIHQAIETTTSLDDVNKIVAQVRDEVRPKPNPKAAASKVSAKAAAKAAAATKSADKAKVTSEPKAKPKAEPKRAAKGKSGAHGVNAATGRSA